MDLLDGLPEGWEIRPFKDEVFFQEGPGIRNWQYVADGVPFVNIRCLIDGRLDRNSMSHISRVEAMGKYEHFLLETGDYVVSSSGTLGRIATVRPSDLPCMLNTSVIRMRPRSDHLDRGYLKYFLHSEYYQAQIVSFATGSAQLNYGPMHLRQMFIVCPPLPEQRAIANILGTLDDKIELNRRMSETLEAMARALFKSWFVDFDPVRAKAEGRDTGLPSRLYGLFPDTFEDSDLGRLPLGYRGCKWSDLVTLKYGKSLRDYGQSEGAYPVFGTNGQIGTHNEPLCSHPGVVVGRKGAYRGIHYCSKPFFVIDTAFYLEPIVDVDLRWAYYELLRYDLNSMDAGSAIPSTSREDFGNIAVSYPPFALQRLYSTTCEPLWSRIERNEAESQTLSALRDTLLPKLMSGEIRVADAKNRFGELSQ